MTRPRWARTYPVSGSWTVLPVPAGAIQEIDLVSTRAAYVGGDSRSENARYEFSCVSYSIQVHSKCAMHSFSSVSSTR
jgi:hypothetical protein